MYRRAALSLALVALITGCPERRQPAPDPAGVLRTTAASHQARQEWEQEAAILDQLLVRDPRDRAALMRRARLVLDHDRGPLDARLVRFDALVAQVRAVADGCDLVRLEDAGAVRRLGGGQAEAIAPAVATWRDGLARCRDHNTGARLNRQLAELLESSDRAAAERHACAAVALGSDAAWIAVLCAGSATAAPAARALAQALTTDDPAARLALLDEALVTNPTLIGALWARLKVLNDLGRTAETCAEIAPYLTAITATWEPGLAPDLARSTLAEHGRALAREFRCPAGSAPG